MQNKEKSKEELMRDVRRLEAEVQRRKNRYHAMIQGLEEAGCDHWEAVEAALKWQAEEGKEEKSEVSEEQEFGSLAHKHEQEFGELETTPENAEDDQGEEGEEVEHIPAGEEA